MKQSKLHTCKQIAQTNYSMSDYSEFKEKTLNECKHPLFLLKLFSHLTYVKTEEKSSKFRIYTGNLSGVNSDCLLLATTAEDLTVFDRLPGQHISLGAYR
jgi:hypothetical protein